jgi:hypothetical protein
LHMHMHMRMHVHMHMCMRMCMYVHGMSGRCTIRLCLYAYMQAERFVAAHHLRTEASFRAAHAATRKVRVRVRVRALRVRALRPKVRVRVGVRVRVRVRALRCDPQG